MLSHKARLSDFVFASIKVCILAALPLAAGIEVGNRASAGDGITGAIRTGQDPIQAFNATLANGYQALAGALDRTGRDPNTGSNDWADAQYFALKAMAADRGENDGPEKTHSWTLMPTDRSALDSARQRLVAAAKKISEIKKTANVAAARALADAQVKFDCWVERAEEAAKGIDQAEDCHQAFQNALTRFDEAVGDQSMAAAIQPPQP